ncbi:hypothetical protein [Sphingomonas sp. GV3]|jgi:hypothetical protein|uniref:hypothetical protein n=1 Tax=Sphingomonas sp. GV3 TaxID=3040671 RepID=UPI00280B0E9A|nr:hypothetical protein [Sphingomonas sp. GV3]
MEQDTLRHDKEKEGGSKRDKRLLFSLICFFAAFCCFIYEAMIIDLYIKTVALGNWDYFSRTFGVAKPYGKDEVCFDFCAPSLPFTWGWIGLANFITGFSIVSLVWLKPRNVNEMKGRTAE